MNEIEQQRRYYDETSHKFDEWHLGNSGDVEHVLACDLIVAYLARRYPTAKLLDIGGGTGRFYRYVRDNHPDARFDLMAIEPARAQRAMAYKAGVPPERHIEGDATQIQFPDDSFDFCTEFGVVHHIKDHRKAIQEMCRVASKGIFLSDCNKYAQGTPARRFAKRILRATGTWNLMDRVRTKGKGYQFSEGDGIFYSFSIFDVLDIVRQKFPNVHYWTTVPSTGPDLISGAPQVLVFASR